MRTRTYALAAAVAAAAAAGPAFAPAANAAGPTTVVSDFNGDGYADLAVGVPNATVDGQAQAGYVDVIWGDPRGLGSLGHIRISQSRPGTPGVPEKGDRFGASVAVADADGNGTTDLVIGAPGEDITGTGADAGTVTVLRGVHGGLGTAFTVADGPAASAAYGKSLAAADFTGDGRTDLAIGATDKVVLRTAAGDLSSVFSDHMGGRAPVLATGDFDDDGTPDLAVAYYTVNAPYTQSHVRLWRWSAEESGMANFWNTDNAAASALAAGDFDGDGHDDLALGNCREIADENIDDPCGPEELAKGGGIHIHYGAAGGGSFGTRAQTLNQDTPGVPGVAENGDGFGSALAVADINGDGRTDLVAGAPGEAIGSRARAGSATVLFGGSQGLLSASGAATSVAYQQDTAGVPGAAETGDAFGAALASDDYDGDHHPDLSVGSPGENASSGGVWVLPGATAPGSVALTPSRLHLPSSSTPLAYGAVLGR
ncbi:FG-GAP-like repeat-containing protein [Streptomyces sp. NPDC002004]